jgi:hypothetical protein
MKAAKQFFFLVEFHFSNLPGELRNVDEDFVFEPAKGHRGGSPCHAGQDELVPLPDGPNLID